MKNINFLIVEDNTLDFIICKNIIEKHYGFYARIITVTSLRDAIDQISKNDLYDIVLLDLNIDDSKGISTLEKFSKKCSVPIIIHSSGSDNKVISQAILHGADGYIIKGVDSPEIIVENINHALENRKFIAQKKKNLQKTHFY